MALPHIMVAPNGARKTKHDHAALPISINEIVETAIACRAAGADGVHAHVREGNGTNANAPHTLDAGLYRELLQEFAVRLPGFYIQITTEAVGRYLPEEMNAIVRDVRPAAVSIGLTEMGGGELARGLYHWANEENIEVQHILYSENDVSLLAQYLADGLVPKNNLCCLLVLGRYSQNMQSSPGDLLPFVEALTKNFGVGDRMPDWAVCAFGQAETECLVGAKKLGGKVRIGFENNMLNRNGSLAIDNAERVREIIDAI